MCGIAGFSLSPESGVDRTLAGRHCSPRSPSAAPTPSATPGAATRVASRTSSSSARGRSALLEQLDVPAEATQLLVHVRDYTKGHPTIEANNHPVRHGEVVGVHNGVIVNDEEIFDRYGIERARPGDDRRLGGDLRAREHAAGHPRGASRSCTARWRPRGSTSAAGSLLRRPRRAPSALDRPAGTALFFASARNGTRDGRADVALDLTKREVARARCCASRTGGFAGPPLPLRPLVRRGVGAAVRARAARGRLLPAAARRDRVATARGLPAPVRRSR